MEDRLRELMVGRYGSVSAFASAVGIPTSTISTILGRGLRRASADNALAICRGLGISADALARGRIEGAGVGHGDSLELAALLSSLSMEVATATEVSLDGRALAPDEARLAADLVDGVLAFMRRRLGQSTTAP